MVGSLASPRRFTKRALKKEPPLPAIPRQPLGASSCSCAHPQRPACLTTSETCRNSLRARPLRQPAKLLIVCCRYCLTTAPPQTPSAFDQGMPHTHAHTHSSACPDFIPCALPPPIAAAAEFRDTNFLCSDPCPARCSRPLFHSALACLFIALPVSAEWPGPRPV